ncbi:MAG: alpha/beta hydrolase [Clostridia bacterium]|nr:alpha/beta hydrolase [Clostridia bacterium]
MASSQSIELKQIEEGYWIDGPGEEKALIFYPGGKVEETAYVPLLRSLAAQGIDCFLLKMPLKLAIFGANRADAIRARYSYQEYYLAGHSLGGVMAANHAAEHLEEYAGLFLLAAYPSKDLSAAKFPVVFLYGENDKVLNRAALEESFSLVPKEYKAVEISGGNHAYFGSYGEQKGDGKATILPQEQWNITTKEIYKYCK